MLRGFGLVLLFVLAARAAVVKGETRHFLCRKHPFSEIRGLRNGHDDSVSRSEEISV